MADSRSPPSAEARVVFAMRGVNKVYRMGDVEVRALRGITLSVEAGEFVAIVGASGSGKSTVMRCICGDEAATTGSIHLASVDGGATALAPGV